MNPRPAPNDAREEPGVVAEIQGVYGAFSFPEKLLQQIWSRQEFLAAGLCTADGRTLRVRHAGRWNRLGGPDFFGAQLELGGQPIEGDVEVHLRAGDWNAHGHAKDPAYDRVVLHVVLFPGAECFTRGANGREIPVLSLLTHLAHDLEEYAAEAAVERLASRASDVFFEEFSQRPLADVRAELACYAERRWQTKCVAAAQRVARLGWDEACHHTALEILGYRNNRAAMLQVAQTFSLARWTAAAAERGVSAQPWHEAAMAAGEPHWNRQGVRPANLPATRLQQYFSWNAARPAWPARLSGLSEQVGRSVAEISGIAGAVGASFGAGTTTAWFRKQHRLAALSRAWRDAVAGDAVGGGRWDTLVCDGLLPLLASREDVVAQPQLRQRLGEFWYFWPMGDLPERMEAALRRLELVGPRDWPASHGVGQGALAWLWAKDSGRAV